MSDTALELTTDNLRRVGHARKRPKHLSPARVRAMCDIVRGGNYTTAACSALSIPWSTYTTWRARGIRERDEGLDEADSVYVLLVNELDKALAEAELYAVHTWQAAFAGDWRASETFLARRFPDRWARGDRDVNALVNNTEIHEVHIHMDGPAPIEAFALPVDQLVEGAFREVEQG